MHQTPNMVACHRDFLSVPQVENRRVKWNIIDRLSSQTKECYVNIIVYRILFLCKTLFFYNSPKSS